jgi:DNA-binding response OmpR family regulator
VVSDSSDAQRTSVLVVDDDRKLCRLIKDYLEPLGYDVATANTGKEGLEKALSGKFDAVILDVMMPEMDGLEVLRRLRAASTDDYLPKTFSTRELLARLRAVIRRSRVTAARSLPASETSEEAPVVVGSLRIEPSSRNVTLHGVSLSLTAVEFDLLLALARTPGRVKSREQLLLEVAERDFEAFDRSIDVHISSLRRKLGDDAKSPRWVQTVRSVGYRLMKPEPEAPQ